MTPHDSYLTVTTASTSASPRHEREVESLEAARAIVQRWQDTTRRDAQVAYWIFGPQDDAGVRAELESGIRPGTAP